MTLKLTAQRVGFGFYPNSAGYQEEMAAIPQHKDLVLMVKMSRNPAQMRYFHAMCRQLILCGAWDGTVDELKEYFCFAVGHSKTFVGPDGEIYRMRKSLSEESMDRLAFTRFVSRCKQVVAQRWGIDVDELSGLTYLDAGPYER